MKCTKSRLFALCLVTLALLQIALPAEAARRRLFRSWELLGTRTVTDRVDHDVIEVTGAKGTFRSLQLRVESRAVQFRSMKLHFGNGATQDVELREVIPAGGESRIIDVEGPGDRVIRSIEFRYDAQSLGGKKAVVKVYGKN